jgi:hypothetical protein
MLQQQQNMGESKAYNTEYTASNIGDMVMVLYLTHLLEFDMDAFVAASIARRDPGCLD